MKYLVFIVSAIVAIGCTQKKVSENQAPVQIRQNTGSTLMTGWYHVVDSSAFKRQLDRDTVFYYIDPSPIVTAENIANMQVFEDDYGRPGLGMMLNEDVVSLWKNETTEAAKEKKSFALIVNDKLIFTSPINGPIDNGSIALNGGNVYSKEYLEETLNAIQQKAK